MISPYNKQGGCFHGIRNWHKDSPTNWGKILCDAAELRLRKCMLHKGEGPQLASVVIGYWLRSGGLIGHHRQDLHARKQKLDR